MWLIDGDKDEAPRFLYSLNGHESSVNCVRWSPDGSAVASAADGGAIIWWSLPAPKDEGAHLGAKQPTWRSVASDSELRKKMVVQHDDVYDLAWAPGSHLLAAASVCCRPPGPTPLHGGPPSPQRYNALFPHQDPMTWNQ